MTGWTPKTAMLKCRILEIHVTRRLNLFTQKKLIKAKIKLTSKQLIALLKE